MMPPQPMSMGDPNQPPMQPQMPEQEGAIDDTPAEGGDSDARMEAYLDYALQETNLAKKLKKRRSEKGAAPGSLLELIGAEIKRGYEEDETSRKGWMDKNTESIKLALLIRTGKTYPWAGASDVKYPLLATAAMQFSARAYPSLVPSDGRLVKTKLAQARAEPALWDAAIRIQNHMSFQILERIPNWEEDMDKLLMTMAISGICFKKTYYDKAMGRHCSNIVYPEDFVVNYHAKSLEAAYRKTEVLRYINNEYLEKVRNDEEFLDIDLASPSNEETPAVTVSENTPPSIDGSTPHVFLQCHTWWDLDDDGYEEPYIITVHKDSGKVVRIVARWTSDGYHLNDKGQVVRIDPVEYYTAFPFIPNPDGSLYALGFGTLLAPLNETVNTLINQLVDAGKMNNLQAGFIGKGLRLKMGETSLRPGEWKVVNATGDDLSKSIFPMPSKEPSAVLMSLLQMLIQSGNQLASIAEIFVGKMPGQNTPATTTQETIQQGMAVFTAIYKRVYRSLREEFKKIYRLNRICPECLEEEKQLSGIPLQTSDYELDEWLFLPGADPSGDSATVKMNKLQQVGSLIQMGTINPMEFTKRVLDANEIPGAEQLLMQPQPPAPDPKQETEKLKQQTMQQKAQLDGAAKQQDMAAKEKLANIELQMKEAEVRHKEQLAALKEQSAAREAKMDQVMRTIEMHFGAQQRQSEVAHTVAANDVKLQTAKAASAQKLQANAAQHAQKQKQKASSGGNKKRR